MYLKEKFNDPNVVVLKLLKIKLKAHYITIDVTLSFLPHYKGNARDFVPEPDFNLVSKSFFRLGPTGSRLELLSMLQIND